MADNKGKTKAAILHELESIKGLLLEDDEIPILQETIADSEPGSSRPLPKHDLDELHDVFQALSHNIRNASGKIGAHVSAAPATRSPGLLDAFVQPTTKTPPVKIEPAGTQGSLFAEGRSGRQKPNDADQDYLDQATVDLLDESLDDDLSTGEFQPETEGKVKDTGFNQPLNYAVSKSITPPPRPALAKASGENPFLPQHIRARLHGNNPPPLFDPVAAEKPPITAASKTATEPIISRQQLIRDLVAAVLPQVEQELRQRLQALTDEQLQDMLNDQD